MCEVYNVNDTPHETNTRRRLDEIISDVGDIQEWVGFEQEYTFYRHGWVYGLDPHNDEPPPQGDYYCGRNIGEKISREHLNVVLIRY